MSDDWLWGDIYKYAFLFEPNNDKRKMTINSGEVCFDVFWSIDKDGKATFIIDDKIQTINHHPKTDGETMPQFNSRIMRNVVLQAIGRYYIEGKKIAYTSVMTGPIKTSA